MAKSKAAVARPVREPVNPPEEVPSGARSPASDYVPEPYEDDEQQVGGSGDEATSSSGSEDSSEDSSDDELA